MKKLVYLLTIAFISAMVSCRSHSSVIESKTDSISSYSLSLTDAVKMISERTDVDCTIDSIFVARDSTSSSVKIFGVKRKTSTTKETKDSTSSRQSSSSTSVSHYNKVKESTTATKESTVAIDIVLIAIVILILTVLYRWYRRK